MRKHRTLAVLLVVVTTAAVPGSWWAQEPPPPPPPTEGTPQPPAQPPAQEPEKAPPAQPQPAAQAPPAEAPISLGEFVLRLAADLKLTPPPSGFSPESAAWALLQKGIKVRPELTAPLTEADVVIVLNGLGYKIRTNTPSRVMSRDRLEILRDTFITQAPAK